MASARVRTPMQQLLLLKHLAVTSTASVKSGRLRWEGSLQPTARSGSYTVRIDYVPPSYPKVTIVTPPLEVPEGRALPHTFPGDRLCLYWRGQWDPSMSIAKTIVPWASEWLLYYELWVVTGEWHGGGHEPATGTKREHDVGSGGAGRQRAARELRHAA